MHQSHKIFRAHWSATPELTYACCNLFKFGTPSTRQIKIGTVMRIGVFSVVLQK